MQPGQHPISVTWNSPSENMVENLWIDDDNSHIVDSDDSRIIIGDYIDANIVGGTHIPAVTWSPGV